jgi:diaminohydroxyphosphoribosylaminopyrimidine deaminase/5-amino-6-(5-phosphoribosylamino)uracil reductase
VERGLVDKLVVYLAPKLVGGGDAAGALGGEGFWPISEALPVRIRSVERVGEDVRVEADVHRDR